MTTRLVASSMAEWLAEYPTAENILKKLPKDVSQSLVDDQWFEGYGKTGKTYAESITDAHSRGEADTVMMIIGDMKERAGTSDSARLCWDKFGEES